MKVDYVTDTSGWERWQCDYRLGLILIMPPEDVASQVNPLRAKYDPKTYAFCPAHITVSDPLGLEMTDERDAEISGILSKVKPFTLHFDEPHASKKRGGVAYPIHPREPIDELRVILHQASVFCRPPYYTRTIAPHMTIAEFVTIEESWQIVEEIKGIAPRGSFVCDRLQFIVPDINMHFQRVKSYRLGGE
ncbi:MAG: 2'-5' RNA ligase family protein [Planctomycetota bacterium]|nr:2'-5' RNA ligase family protein [Planctomycetota bacterium]